MSYDRQAVSCVPAGWKGLGRGVLVDAGICRRADGLIAIPYRSIDGGLLRTRLVAPSGRRWWARDGEGVHLFGAETLAWTLTCEPVLVCEGESCALAARELLEVRAVAVPGATTWRSEWAVLLDRFPRVYVVGDGDAAGTRFVWSVRASLPWVRPVLMPGGRDLRDLLQAGEVERCGRIFDRADEDARVEYAFAEARDLDTCLALLGGGR